MRAGEPLQLNCTPDAHSSSGQNVPSFDLEDSSGSTSITQLSYRLSKNGAEVMTAAAGSSGLFNVSNAANVTDSGMYSCVVQEDIFQKVANIISVARRRRAVVRLPVVSFLSTVLLNRVMDTSLSTAVSFSVVVGGESITNAKVHKVQDILYTYCKYCTCVSCSMCEMIE